MKDQSFLRRISIALFVVMLLMFIVHVQILVSFNLRVYNVHGITTSAGTGKDIRTGWL